MAEAPEGPPRKTTTYNRFSTMASQNERYNTKDDEFFWLENIMRVAPHKLHSVPGPGRATRFPLTSICSDSTERGQQSLSIEMAFNQTAFTGLFNARTSWAHVENGQLYTMIGNADCGGGNMNYFAFGLASPGVPPSCTNQYFFSTDDGVSSPTPSAPVAEDSHLPGINTRVGTSDIPAYAFGASGNLYIGYPTEGIKVAYNLNLLIEVPCFGVNANTVWIKGGPGGSVDGKTHLREYDRLSGTLLNDYTPWGTDTVFVNNINVTSDRIICLVGNSTTGKSFLTKLDYTGAIISELPIDGIVAVYMFAENDDLQYFLCQAPDGVHAPLYYYNSTGNLVYVGTASGVVQSPFSASGYFNNGVFYFGGSGFAGLSVDIQKIAIDCPPAGGALIASVSTGSTVAAGASIDVTWADILITSSTDRIQLQVAPTGGKLGFSGATANFVSTGSAASGTASFTIPGGTTPGSYIFQLCTLNGTILIATSNTFTVT